MISGYPFFGESPNYRVHLNWRAQVQDEFQTHVPLQGTGHLWRRDCDGRLLGNSHIACWALRLSGAQQRLSETDSASPKTSKKMKDFDFWGSWYLGYVIFFPDGFVHVFSPTLCLAQHNCWTHGSDGGRSARSTSTRWNTKSEKLQRLSRMPQVISNLDQ